MSTDVSAHSALPGPLRLQPSFPFVDRPREMATLRSLLPRAKSEGRRIALVGGEPGSGKSRLVREIAHQAAKDGALVLYGACDAVVRTPYRPFVEALDQLVRSSDPAELRDDLGAAGGELTRLLPDLRSHVGDLPEPVVADQDTERHRLNAAVSDLLVAAGRRRPLLLVFEDGHWADTPTLLLLRHLAAGATDARMLLFAAFRNTEADVPAELSEALIDMRRSDGVVRVRVGALTGEQVSEFVERAAGAPLGPALPELAGAITSLTQGNVFLVTELWRELVETGALEIVDGVALLTRPLTALGTPESVREVVNQRLARLQPETALVLELAAVTGPEFDLSVLRGGGFTDATLSAALEQSMRSGMIEEIPARQLRYRFSHELVRRALYDRLAGLRRAQLHLQVAESMEASGAADTARGLADLAHHFAAAAPIDGPQRAVEYNLRAADAANAALAFGEAVGPLKTALELGVDNETAHAEIELELGAAHYRAGQSGDSLEAFQAAAETARRLHNPDLLARAAIGVETACWRVAMLDEGAIELLEEALAALDPGDSTMRVLLLSGLARARALVGESQRSAELRDEAIAIARRIDQPFIIHVAEHYRSAIALCEGRLAEAEEAAERSREWSRLLTGRDASGVYGVQMFSIRREQGRLAELAPVVRVLAGGDRRGGSWRPGLAALTAELGMLDEARAQLALIQSDGIDVYRHALWVGSLTYIADACVAVGDADLSQQVYRELLSIAERNVMIGHGVACYGSSERYLGTLAAAYGELELAELHLQRAIDYNRDMGAITWLAHSDYEYARTLGAQGRAGEPAAQAALAEASDLAERIGMPALLGRIRGLLPAGPATSRLPDGLSAREAEILRLVAQGRSNRQIGRTLHISEHTAANHIRSILRKTGCANRTEAASYAHTRGLTERG